jgi:hypothetical protein
MRAKYNDCDDLKLGTAMMPSVPVTPVRLADSLQAPSNVWWQVAVQDSDARAALRLHVTLDSSTAMMASRRLM